MYVIDNKFNDVHLIGFNIGLAIETLSKLLIVTNLIDDVQRIMNLVKIESPQR